MARKLNLDRMRHHRVRSIPDQMRWEFPRDTTFDEMQRAMNPWMRDIRLKHKNNPNASIDIEQQNRPDYNDLVVVARVRIRQ